MRSDLEIIKQWIKPQSSLLDLGCGDGSFLQWLGQNKQVRGYGLEIDSRNITQCIAAGVNVVEPRPGDGDDDFSANEMDEWMQRELVVEPLMDADDPSAPGAPGETNMETAVWWYTPTETKRRDWLGQNEQHERKSVFPHCSQRGYWSEHALKTVLSTGGGKSVVDIVKENILQDITAALAAL